MNINLLRKFKSHFLSLSLLAACLATGSLSYPRTLLAESSDSEEAIRHANLLSSAFARAAEVITPSVVTINSVVKAKPMPGRRRARGHDPFFDPFRDFLGPDFFDRMQPDSEGYARKGMGTGVIVDSSGYVLTNNHVIDGADEVTVQLSSERRFKAKVIGVDPRTDIAVVKIQGPSLTAAKLGDSDTLKIGEWVIAAGNPFAFTNSITAGIVSALGRSVPEGEKQFDDFIQTDAAINPGNSGGPLVNLKGEVIGINTAIVSQSGGYMGIGFAIPINKARVVMNSLIKTGKVTRGWLGVGIQPVSEDLGQSFGYGGTDGALVSDLVKEGPAAKAGIKQGDIITALNGKKIRNVNELRNFVASNKPGSSLEVSLYRDGHEKQITVEIGELPREKERSNEEESEKPSVDIGIEVDALTPQVARQLQSTHSRGVVVTQVQPGSMAESAGLQPRDVIVSVNGTSVETVSQFYDLLEKANLKKGVRFVVESGGMEHFVFLKSEE